MVGALQLHCSQTPCGPLRMHIGQCDPFSACHTRIFWQTVQHSLDCLCKLLGLH